MVPVSESFLQLHRLEQRGGQISPAEFSGKAIPNSSLRRIGSETRGKQDLCVALAVGRQLNEFIMTDAQKTAKMAIQARGQA